ncbi:single-stranded DNA-binding protein [Kovacikia minuta CCNUW1]|uniref:single-stranded DNA-binding protein n=1 Tax=Kovacikia minuta TaxID=2931930 RepID=UPI001CCFC5AA|nr:single-stranded DNA-binding protein [Kovacikia minuta]UBF27502.1 single-stranded DNA-binding protein [Kovacikia minuta CCNUW1]
MSSVGLNKWIVSGNLAADAEIKTVDLKSGEKAQVAEATLYVRKVRNWKESFTVSLSIWERSPAWRKLPYLKKGSLIICTGNVEPNPYITKTDKTAKAGLAMTVVDIDLDNVKSGEEEDEQPQTESLEEPTGQEAQPARSQNRKNGKAAEAATSA